MDSEHDAGAHRNSLGRVSVAEVMARETDGIDVRFAGTLDVTELPSACRSSASVEAAMDRFRLCRTVDRLIPYGCMMAGCGSGNIRSAALPGPPA